jgi:hypothetical protein
VIAPALLHGSPDVRPTDGRLHLAGSGYAWLTPG